MSIGLEEFHAWAAYYPYDQLLTNIAGFVSRACRWVPGQRLGRTEANIAGFVSRACRCVAGQRLGLTEANIAGFVSRACRWVAGQRLCRTDANIAVFVFRVLAYGYLASALAVQTPLSWGLSLSVMARDFRATAWVALR